ncbi:IclR family transcriptional regulator [Planococcus beijingensis]|uniref:IclR family transcriptional regulator n=1 Tax=Planococcus beijingensis TaxID=2782551 RepID=UPI00193C7492|nr:IclR family transcriptional regulator [Planococcus beijingensis]
METEKMEVDVRSILMNGESTDETSMKKTSSDVRDTSINQSVEKAISILNLYSAKELQFTVNEISELAKINKATVIRLCNTLEKAGFIERFHDSRASYYRLGIGLGRLGNIVIQSLDLTSRAKPYLKKLTDLTGDNSYLFIEKNNMAQCIDIMKGPRMYDESSVELGDTLQLNQGGAPMAIFAHLSALKKEKLLTKLNLEEEEKLIGQLEVIRKNGYSLSQGDILPHIAAVGAPIIDFRGNVIGALSQGGLAREYVDERLSETIKIVKEAARELSREFGWEEEI